MKQTVAAFATGALVASAIAIVMNRKPEPAPEPVKVVQAAPVSEAPALATEPKPVPAPEPAPAPAPVSEPVRKTVPKAKAMAERPVTVARVETPAARPEPVTVAAPVAQPAAAAPPPQPVVTNREPAPKPAPERAAVTLNPPPGTTTEMPAKPVRTAKTVTIPEGTLIPVRLLERLSSDVQASGDTFSASLAEPLIVDGLAIAEKNARIEGRVVQSEKGGRVKGTSFLSVELTQLSTADGQKVAIHTQTFERKANQGSKTDDAKKVGVGAAIGAAIGAIAGGGKGAAIGAGAGGAAGGGVVLAGRGKPAELPVETRIDFKLTQSVTLTEKLAKAN